MKHESVLDEIDGLLQGKYQLTVNRIEFEELTELQENKEDVDIMRVNRRDLMSR